MFTTKLNDSSPIWNKNQSLLKKKINKTKLKKIILCDNFVFKSSLLSSNYDRYFNKIINKLSYFTDSTLILPIQNVFFEKKNYKNLIKKISYFIEESNIKKVKISFEVQVSLQTILRLKKDLNNELFKITFDTGNIFIIDRCNKSLITYFNKTKNFTNHVHLKDRDINDNNVIFGTGIINFKEFFKIIKKAQYNQTFTFETNRGQNFMETAKNNLIFVKSNFH